MGVRLSIFAALFLNAILLPACGDDGSTPSTHSIEYQPHTPLDIPGEGDIADPHVIKVGNTWYLYATKSELAEGFRVWTSDDLATWEDRGLVWEPTPGSWQGEGDFWAPHVEAADDDFYMYYTAAHQIGLARSESPLGPFVDVADHPLVGGGYGGVGEGTFDHGSPFDFDEYAIDAFVLALDDGSLVLYHTVYDPVSRIVAVPMVDFETVADVERTVVIEPVTSSWEGLINEGPWVIQDGDSIHLMYSGNVASSASYAIGVAVADDPFGPFERYPNNPILASSYDAAFYGPGHHSVVEGAHDDLLMFYHTKISAEVVYDRLIRYAPISFGDNGRIQLDVFAP